MSDWERERVATKEAWSAEKSGGGAKTTRAHRLYCLIAESRQSRDDRIAVECDKQKKDRKKKLVGFRITDANTVERN